MLPMKILISESEIQDRVRQLGSEISQDYNARMPTLVCVLKGSIIFFADVVRAITLDVTCEFVQISSYEDKSVSSGEANLVFNSQPNLANTDVIIIVFPVPVESRYFYAIRYQGGKMVLRD